MDQQTLAKVSLYNLQKQVAMIGTRTITVGGETVLCASAVVHNDAQGTSRSVDVPIHCRITELPNGRSEREYYAFHPDLLDVINGGKDLLAQEKERYLFLERKMKVICQENMSLQMSLSWEETRSCAFYGAPLWRRFYLALFPGRA